MRIGLPSAETLQGGSLKALILVSLQSMEMPLRRRIHFTWDGFVMFVELHALPKYFGYIVSTLLDFILTLLCIFLSQTVLLSVFMFQLLRTVGLRAFSMASETYTSGTHSAAFVTCPNDTVAKDLAR